MTIMLEIKLNNKEELVREYNNRRIKDGSTYMRFSYGENQVYIQSSGNAIRVLNVNGIHKVGPPNPTDEQLNEFLHQELPEVH